MSVVSLFANHSVKISWEEKFKMLFMVWYFRQYPTTFIRAIMGIKLAPHQQICIDKAWRTTHMIWQLSRGMAKTFMGATMDGALGCLYRSYKVQCTAGGSFKQTEQTFDYLESIVRGEVLGQEEKHFIDKLLPKTGKVVTKQPSNWLSKIGTSVIRGLAIKGGNRGFRGNMLELGEANDIERDAVDKILRPFLNVKYDPMNQDRNRKTLVPQMRDKRKLENFLLMSGTISYDFTYYYSLIKEYIKKMEDGDPDYGYLEFNFEDTYLGKQTIEPGEQPEIDIFFYGMDLKEILAPLNENNTSYESWLAEQKNVPIATEGKFFPPQLIFTQSWKRKDGEDAQLCPRIRSNGICFMGVDPMAGSKKGQKTETKNAEFAITIIELFSNYAGVVHCFGQTGVEPGEGTRLILNYLEQFPNIVSIDLDMRGGGTPVRDNLRNGLLGNIPIIDPTDPDNEHYTNINTAKPHRPILRLVAPTDEYNTTENELMRNAIRMGQLLIPYTAHGQFDYDRDLKIPQYADMTEQEIEKLYKDIHIMKTQMTCVETEPTRNYLSFSVRSGQKDRYSSMLYASAGLRRYLLENAKKTQAKVPGIAWG